MVGMTEDTNLRKMKRYWFTSTLRRGGSAWSEERA
jgi:hypothetical protein